MTQLLIAALAGLLGGAANAVAGGGSFITFPALILTGMPPVAANQTSSVALLPGGLASSWAYRSEIRSFDQVALPVMVVPT
ncbi:MAG: TSUP family transporter, partial [Alphaproteobacteria bacterium]|nr:TSUP family transporter [Alphaproteobacteria bacterium]